MTREEATKAAREIAIESHLAMAVTHNPYEEYEQEYENQFNYCPASAAYIFRTETLIETIPAGG